MNFRTIALTSLALALALPAAAQAASTRDEVKALREEVAALKAGQEQIQKDLAEVVKLLERGAAAPRPPGQQPFRERDIDVGGSPYLGQSDATVTVVEFSDYQCPYCKRHATTVMRELVEQYAESGQVKFVMREFPIENIHPRALAASQAALCAADQGRYWEMHDLIFADQRALADAQLKAHAATLGLDQQQFDACYDGGSYTERIRAHQAEAASMGITGTPSFVLGITDADNPDKVRLTRFIRGAQPRAAFEAAIEELLKEAADPGEAGG